MSAPLLSLTGARWETGSATPEQVQAICARSGLSEVAARVLAQRWDSGAPPAMAWEAPRMEDLHDPLKMHNMSAAIDRLSHALRHGQKLRIITDYDVDGTTSSLILQATLRILSSSADISYHIPNRFDEGYGFSVRAARQAAEDGVGLIITADIGVRDHAAVEAANEAGVDVLICDHHLPAGASVPASAIVLCPPQRDCDYPNPSLAACGVSLKLAQAMLADHPKCDTILRSMLKLAAIGTVADLVPLRTRENRAIVSLGLAELNAGPHHAGLASLLDVSGVQAGQIRTSDLGFRIGPRINAAGRVSDAKLVVELLNQRDPHQAREMAAELNRLNDARRAIQRRVEEAALERVDASPPAFVVVADTEENGWHRGVVGIVASRIKEELNRPTAVVSIQGETSVGSVRSVPGVHAVEALDSASDLLVRYGGHPAAAGFTVHTHQISALQDRLSAFVQTHRSDDDLVRVRRHDGMISAASLADPLRAELQRIGPWGMGYPRPRFVVRAIRPVQVQTLSGGKHLKFRIPQASGRTIEAIWWGQGDLADTIRDTPVDLLGELGQNHYRGTTRLQFEVKDIRVATSAE